MLQGFGQSETPPAAAGEDKPGEGGGSGDPQRHEEAGRGGEAADLGAGGGNGRRRAVALDGNSGGELIQRGPELGGRQRGRVEKSPRPARARYASAASSADTRAEATASASPRSASWTARRSFSSARRSPASAARAAAISASDGATKRIWPSAALATETAPRCRLSLLLGRGIGGHPFHSVGIGIDDRQGGEQPDHGDQCPSGNAAGAETWSMAGAAGHGLVTSAVWEWTLRGCPLVPIDES